MQTDKKRKILNIFKIYFAGYESNNNARLSNPMVLKRVPLGSPKEEFLIPGKNFVPGRNWGGKAMDEKSFFL